MEKDASGSPLVQKGWETWTSTKAKLDQGTKPVYTCPLKQNFPTEPKLAQLTVTQLNLHICENENKHLLQATHVGGEHPRGTTMVTGNWYKLQSLNATGSCFKNIWVYTIQK